MFSAAGVYLLTPFLLFHFVIIQTVLPETGSFSFLPECLIEALNDRLPASQYDDALSASQCADAPLATRRAREKARGEG